MTLKHDVLNALARHQGKANGIRARDLAAQLGITPRRLRKLITELREKDGNAICGRPSSGYFLPLTGDELQETCAFLEHRALHSLRMLARMRRVSMPDLIGQLKLNQA